MKTDGTEIDEDEYYGIFAPTDTTGASVLMIADLKDPAERPLVMRHVAWGCRTCNKIDWVDDDEARAKPEHVPHRGVDIGSCKGKMIKLYSA